MRISDWSSDVCSSDLLDQLDLHLVLIRQRGMHLHRRRDAATVTEHGRVAIHRPRTDPRELHPVLDAGIDILDHISDLLDRAESRIHGRSPEGKLGGNHGAASVPRARSEEHTSELQSLMRNSYAVFCLKT